MRKLVKSPFVLSVALAALMVVQPGLGLAFPEQYRDVERIRATWFGNDWITLALAAPLLTVALVLIRRGSIRGELLWLGVLGYGVYNYAFYLFGAALNVSFPLYVAAFLLSASTLILALTRLSVARTAGSFRARTPVRLIGGYLVFVGISLSAVWIVLWAAYIFGERPLPVGPEEFKLVAVLDLTLMVPALVGGGILLWRRRPWGYIIAAIAGVQGALYLLVLAVNSAVAIRRGLADAPGELPVWVPLAAATALSTTVLLYNLRDGGAGEAGKSLTRGAA